MALFQYIGPIFQYNGARFGFNKDEPDGVWNQITRSDAMEAWRYYVKTEANQLIAWGWDTYPFPEWDQGNAWFQAPGTQRVGNDVLAGISDTLSEGSFGSAGSVIGTGFVGTLIDQTRMYLRLRNMNAKLYVTGDGGNTGSRPTPGEVFNMTRKAHLNDFFLADWLGTPYTDPLNGYIGYGFSTDGVAGSGGVITNDGVLMLMRKLTAKYLAAAAITAIIHQVDVCHASCHSSCHGSRGRR
jgi:hypothetical protein